MKTWSILRPLAYIPLTSPPKKLHFVALLCAAYPDSYAYIQMPPSPPPPTIMMTATTTTSHQKKPPRSSRQRLSEFLFLLQNCKFVLRPPRYSIWPPTVPPLPETTSRVGPMWDTPVPVVFWRKSTPDTILCRCHQYNLMPVRVQRYAAGGGGRGPSIIESVESAAELVLGHKT